MHDRIATFSHRPKEQDFCVPLGLGLMATSGIRIDEADDQYVVRPVQIPVRAASLLMCLVAFASLIAGACLKEVSVMAASVFGLVFVVPTASNLFRILNRRIGDQPYLVVHEDAGEVEFCRLKKRWPVGSVSEIVQVSIGRDRVQVLFVIEELDESWRLVHAFNEFGDKSKLYQRIAERLGVTGRLVEFSEEEAQALQMTQVSRPTTDQLPTND